MCDFDADFRQRKQALMRLDPRNITYCTIYDILKFNDLGAAISLIPHRQLGKASHKLSGVKHASLVASRRQA
jgi:hypothetical protein